jgi:hypothetical protein
MHKLKIYRQRVLALCDTDAPPDLHYSFKRRVVLRILRWDKNVISAFDVRLPAWELNESPRVDIITLTASTALE